MAVKLTSGVEHDDDFDHNRYVKATLCHEQVDK